MMRADYSKDYSANIILGGGGIINISKFADISPLNWEFRHDGKIIPALKWKNGKIFALNTENETEYLYLHLQKRAMKFEPGLENEESFIIIPNEFMKDHELTQEEITQATTPRPEYRRAMFKKYSAIYVNGKSFSARFKKLASEFFSCNTGGKIVILKRMCNTVFGREIPD